MGFHRDLMGFNGGLMGFHRDLMMDLMVMYGHLGG